MSKFRIKKRANDDVFSLPKKIISKLAEAGEKELKLFITLASLDDGKTTFTKDEIKGEMERVGILDDDVSEALAFLRGAGLIEKIDSKKSEKKEEKSEEKKGVHTPSSKPSYTSKELASVAKSGEFRELLEYASSRIGKTFNTSEIATLYSFIDYLKLPCDVIMLGIEHCVSEGKGSLRYVEKFLITLADSDIDTYEKAEGYIKSRKEYLAFEGGMRRLLGLGERALTTKERAIISKWQEWGFDKEMLTLAYEKTVDNTSKFSINYMSKILESWHTSGFRSVKEVMDGDKKPTDTHQGFDPEEFFRSAIEKKK